MNNDKVFLNNIQNKIQAGEYDNYLTLPFMTKKLIYSAIKGRIERRIEKGGTPILTSAEIVEAIEDAKEAAGSTFYLFVNSGILEKTDDGLYQLSRKGKIALRSLSKF